PSQFITSHLRAPNSPKGSFPPSVLICQNFCTLSLLKICCVNELSTLLRINTSPASSKTFTGYPNVNLQHLCIEHSLQYLHPNNTCSLWCHRSKFPIWYRKS